MAETVGTADCLDPEPRVREEWIACLRGRLEEVPWVRFAYLHGSLARGEPCRDVDLGVSVDPDAPGEDDLDRRLDLYSRLATALPLPVDVQVLDRAPVLFRFRVLREGREIYRRPDVPEEEAADLLERTLIEYPDAHRRLREAMADLGVE